MKKVIIFLSVVFILSIIACSGASTPAEHAPAPTVTKEAKKTVKPKPQNYDLTPGNYSVKKGDKGHIQPGTYDIKCVSGSGNVIAADNGWDDMINLIMAPKTDDFYIHEYKNAKLNNNAKLQVENVTIKLIGVK